MKLQEGRWFSKADNSYKERPVVINEAFKEALFANDNAIGKIIGTDADKKRVIGVVANFKDKSDFQAPTKGMFNRIDTGEIQWNNTILIKVDRMRMLLLRAVYLKRYPTVLKIQISR